MTDLDVLAILSGHRHPLDFPPPLRPDVARVDHRHATVFVADGKHSESPACSATAERFTAYLLVGEAWAARGYHVTVAVGHQPQGDRWLSFLEQLCARSGIDVTASAVEAFAVDMAVSWARIGPRRDVRPPDP